MNAPGLPPAVSPVPALQRPGWVLAWHDEFDGPTLDRAKWDFDLGDGFLDARTQCWVPGWGNDELQTYTDAPENVQLRDGCLVIRALRLPDGRYTSGRIKTRTRDGRLLFGTCFGRIEVRARVPWGKGLWPAIWMLPAQDRYGGWAASGEIDLMEIIGTDPHRVLNSLHFGSAFPKRSLVTTGHVLPGGSSVADWHTYAVEWGPGAITFFVDEVATCTYRHWWSCSRTADGQGIEATGEADLNPWPAPFDQPFHLLLNVAVGGNFPGHPDAATRFPAELVVDWVRVWDKVDGWGATQARGPGVMPWDPDHQSERHF